jgi:hypothetical protein
MYTCCECGWKGEKPDEWTHDLHNYVQGSEGGLVCIPIGSCPAETEDGDYICGASIFEPSALAELDLMTEMVALLEKIHFRHRDLDPAIISAIGKARRLGWSTHRRRSPIDFKE